MAAKTGRKCKISSQLREERETWPVPSGGRADAQKAAKDTKTDQEKLPAKHAKKRERKKGKECLVNLGCDQHCSLNPSSIFLVFFARFAGNPSSLP